MTYFQRLAATGSLALGLLLATPVAAIACAAAPRSIDLSSVVITSNGDDSGWTISFETPSDAPANASYIVATVEGSNCTASGTDTPGDTVSCAVPLLEDPSAEPTVLQIDLVLNDYDPITNGFAVDASSATVTLNDAGSAWKITWKTLPDFATDGSYVVTTTDGSTCTADAADAPEGLVSCEVGLLDDPEAVPEVATIRYFVAVPYNGGEGLSVDVSTATITLNSDGNGWTVTWIELASEGAPLPYVVVATNGDTCFAEGTGVEGSELSCDLPMMNDSTEIPQLESIRTIAYMPYWRSAMNSDSKASEFSIGTTTSLATSNAPVTGVQQAVPTVLTDDMEFSEGGRSSAWVWASGMVLLLLGSGVMLRRQTVSRSSDDA